MEDDKRQAFLAEAKKADELAARATDPQLRESWRKIAEGYRELARFKG